jgi:hypothetical protein
MMHATAARRGGSAAIRLAIAGAALLLAPAARADDAPLPKGDNRARAQQLFDSALADAEAGNLAAACPKFLASQYADPKTSTLLNLASCYEKNGQTASAWGAFREAEGLARKTSRPDWETAARARADELEPKLVRLTIQVAEPSRVAGLSVTRDGARLAAGEWGVAIPVDPGEHVVGASAPGREPWETKASIRDASATVAVPVLAAVPAPVDTPPPVAAPAERSPEAPPSWWTPLRATGAVVAGVGILGLATGSALGLVAKGGYDDARARCSNGSQGCPSGAVADSDSAYGLATGASVVFVVGAAAALGGAALILFSGEPSTRAQSGSSRPPGARAALHLGPGAVGVHGRW